MHILRITIWDMLREKNGLTIEEITSELNKNMDMYPKPFIKECISRMICYGMISLKNNKYSWLPVHFGNPHHSDYNANDCADKHMIQLSKWIIENYNKNNQIEFNDKTIEILKWIIETKKV